MSAVAFTISYNGSLFSGYQFQPGQKTVQGDLEKALTTYLRTPASLDVCGRTDSGVHASGQVVGLNCADESASLRVRNLILEKPGQLIRSIGALTNHEVIIRKIHPVPESFHPRFSCIAREYEYLIAGYPPSPLRTGQVWVPRHYGLPESFETDALNRITDTLVGHQDFCTFTRAEHKEETTIRYIDSAVWSRKQDPVSGSPLISFMIRGNAFLHNMIRIIAGTAIDIYRGHIQKSMKELLQLCDRTQAGMTAPPYALYLRNCFYAAEKWSDSTGLETLEGYPVFRPDMTG